MQTPGTDLVFVPHAFQACACSLTAIRLQNAEARRACALDLSPMSSDTRAANLAAVRVFFARSPISTKAQRCVTEKGVSLAFDRWRGPAQWGLLIQGATGKANEQGTDAQR